MGWTLQRPFSADYFGPHYCVITRLPRSVFRPGWLQGWHWAGLRWALCGGLRGPDIASVVWCVFGGERRPCAMSPPFLTLSRMQSLANVFVAAFQSRCKVECVQDLKDIFETRVLVCFCAYLIVITAVTANICVLYCYLGMFYKKC